MGNIRQLDDTLSNMIAAGEVVENMASVIKELVENALDANARTIDITLEQSGLRRLRVLDDGEGMDPDDLVLAFKRHATSKIKTHHDLHHIGSLGFRGEALPSIASVAKIDASSSPRGEPAHTLHLRGGEIIQRGRGTARRGTTIDVANLFYNTPARLKHLKSESRELSMIVDYVNKLALAHPHVAFTLSNNDKPLLRTPGDGDPLKILHQIYPTQIIKDMRAFDAANQYFRVRGYLAPPTHTRSTNQHIALIANNRTIKNTRLRQVVRDAYGTTLFTNQYPIVLLIIEVDPLLIDVNVHPQKTDVKFSEQSMLEQLIKSTIGDIIASETMIPNGAPPSRQKAEQVSFETTPTALNESSKAYEGTINADTQQTSMGTAQNKQSAIGESSGNKGERSTPPSNTSTEDRLPELEYIGQFLGTYLLFQNSQGLYVMDQHAAAERIRYETYYVRMQSGAAMHQTLLSPFEIHLSNAEVAALDDYKDTLESFGLSLRQQSTNTLEVASIPGWFRKNMEQTYTEAMIRTFLNGDVPSIGSVIDQLAKDLACKHSIRANKYINPSEVNKLLEDLRATQNPFHCPHGRPILISITTRELETMFKRVAP